VAAPSGGLWIAGVDSCWGGDPQVERALAQVPADATATLVLGHEPHLATLHRRFLHVAGHTHAAQMRVPRALTARRDRFLPRYSQPYVDGTYERDGGSEAGGRSFVHTSSGVGYSTVGWRFNCPPEIVVIDL
jgi:predicted MPP superfamily phosphohydrolase